LFAALEVATGKVKVARRATQGHIDAFVETDNKTAEPFVWTNSKVYQRQVKGRRLSELSGY
jgi:hypothetical protein